MNAPATKKHVAPFPSEATGMKEVSHNVFFQTVGQRNVHPHIVSRPYDLVAGYVQQWKCPPHYGQIIGVTNGGTALAAKRYWIRQA